MKLSKTNQAVVVVHTKGYRVIDGKLYNPKGVERKTRPKNNPSVPYLRTTFRVEGKSISIPIHKLAAYQKFGNKVFESGILVRHLNANSFDNRESNLELGTSLDNFNDMSEANKKKLLSNLQRGNKKRKKIDVDNIIR